MPTITIKRPEIEERPLEGGFARFEPDPRYAVVLHNDDINTFDFVIKVLQKVFGYGALKASWLTMKAHCAGRSAVWTGHLEVAELRAEQIVSCGPDPTRIDHGARPLRVTIEPLMEN